MIFLFAFSFVCFVLFLIASETCKLRRLPNSHQENAYVSVSMMQIGRKIIDNMINLQNIH